MNEMMSKVSEEVLAINWRQNDIERVFRFGDFEDHFQRTTYRVQMQEWLEEILVRVDKVSKLIETNKSLMSENVIGRNGMTPLFMWMMGIMSWYNEYEAKIKTL